MSTPSCRCRIASASLSPHGTTCGGQPHDACMCRTQPTDARSEGIQQLQAAHAYLHPPPSAHLVTMTRADAKVSHLQHLIIISSGGSTEQESKSCMANAFKHLCFCPAASSKHAHSSASDAASAWRGRSYHVLRCFQVVKIALHALNITANAAQKVQRRLQ